MPIDWAPFVELVQQHQRFLLTTHIRPDPDGLGSMLGLAEALEWSGKQVQLVIASVFPPRYRYLDHKNRVHVFEAPGTQYDSAQVIVVLDTGTWGQLGEFGPYLRQHPARKVVIDHHVSQDDLGGILLCDTTAEATGRLVVEAVQALGLTLTQAAANALFAALATDTGWFRHSNTRADTFSLAAELTRAGALPTFQYDQIYEQNSAARLNLVGLVLQRLQVIDEGRISYTELHLSDYAATGALPQDTEDIVQYTRSITGVEAGIFFLEQPTGGVKVSFRSRGRLDVAKIAEQFSGGGHRLASGAVIHAPLAEVKERIFTAIRTALAV